MVVHDFLIISFLQVLIIKLLLFFWQRHYDIYLNKWNAKEKKEKKKILCNTQVDPNLVQGCMLGSILW